MTIFDRLLNYFLRAKPTLTAKELARVNSANPNTTRKLIGKLLREGKIRKGEKVIRNGRLVNTYELLEEIEEFVIKYLSSILYCGEQNASHRVRKNAYAYTFELTSDKDIDRSDDLYEEIKKFSRNCFEIDIDELDQFGKNFGYGVEPRKRIEDQYIYPSIAVRIDGVKLQ